MVLSTYLSIILKNRIRFVFFLKKCIIVGQNSNFMVLDGFVFLYIEALLSWQALLRCDLPFYMVPFTTEDLKFTKPEVCEQSTSLPQLIFKAVWFCF